MVENGLMKAAEPRDGTEETRTVTVTPRVDVLETNDELFVLADFPGVEPGDLDIRFENGELTVHGRRAGGTASYFRNFRVTEQIAADKIEAELKQGVLTLRLPKVEAIKPRRIAVKG
jgi:HSP20 family protein